MIEVHAVIKFPDDEFDEKIQILEDKTVLYQEYIFDLLNRQRSDDVEAIYVSVDGITQNV